MRYPQDHERYSFARLPGRTRYTRQLYPSKAIIAVCTPSPLPLTWVQFHLYGFAAYAALRRLRLVAKVLGFNLFFDSSSMVAPHVGDVKALYDKSKRRRGEGGGNE